MVCVVPNMHLNVTKVITGKTFTVYKDELSFWLILFFWVFCVFFFFFLSFFIH